MHGENVQQIFHTFVAIFTNYQVIYIFINLRNILYF